MIVLGNVDFLRLEFLDVVLHHPLVEIFSAQVRISVCGNHFENTPVNVEESNIKSTTPKIKYENDGVLNVLVETIGNGSRRWLVDDTFHGQPSNRTGILGRLSLSIIEIGRYRNHSMVHIMAQVGFCSRLHLGQDHCGDLLGCKGVNLSLL
mmetsp:Transcript_11269/g.26113  ORF Transcript_11269/g.26113 Transcript_11269/m.26113 type:complete len:151 (-) Transcript_11269:144-596(-)